MRRGRVNGEGEERVIKVYCINYENRIMKPISLWRGIRKSKGD
jgi:hypothetical protein